MAINASYMYPYSSATDPKAANYMGRLETKQVPTNTNSGGGGGSNMQVGGWYDGRQWDGSRLGNPGEIIVGGGGGGDQGGGGGGGAPSVSWEDMISDMYAPALSALDTAKSGAQEGYDADVKNVESRSALEAKKYGTEKENLISDTESEQDKFNKVLKSALSEAVRAYNALDQQKMARFGGGSSAGEAVGELARKEFFRQQGQVQEKGVEGTEEFAKERARIGQYISEKISDLDQYKNEALAELKKNLTNTLSEIAMRKGDIEANKTNAKMAALQAARDRVDYIRQSDVEFRRNLGLAAVNQLQEIAGRAFTPQEIKATMAEFGITMPNLGPSSAGSQVYAYGQLGRAPQNQDELEALNPYTT